MPNVATRRAWLLLGASSTTALLALGGWAAYDAVQGARSLERAADGVRGVRDVQEPAVLVDGLRAAGVHTADARQHLDNPLLGLAVHLPRVGEPLEVARGLARATDLAVRGGALPMLDVAGRDVAERLVKPDGAVDLDLLGRLAQPASGAASALQAAADELTGLPRNTGVQRLDTARAEVAAELGDLRPVVQELSLAARLLPDLLGQEETKRYLVVPQNLAEPRGTGGLVGGYTLLEARGGKLRVAGSAPNTVLFGQRVQGEALDLDEEFDAHYGVNGALKGWVNSNLSPHFPYAGQLWTTLWEAPGRPVLDGVLAVDPVVLSSLLTVTGPVALPDGTQVTGQNVVDLTLRDVYARFPDDDQVRNAYLQGVSGAVASRLTSGVGASRALIEALADSARERRLLFWAADERVREQLGDRSLAGQLPRGRALGDVVVDAAGSKLGYYLDRELTYRVGCADRRGRVSVTLTNGAPASGLPEYVTPTQFRQGNPAGTAINLVWLYAPQGSTLGELRIDGRPTPYRQGTERGLRWLEAVSTIQPGQSQTVEVDFEDPSGEGRVQTIDQPLVRPEKVVRTPC